MISKVIKSFRFKNLNNSLKINLTNRFIYYYAAICQNYCSKSIFVTLDKSSFSIYNTKILLTYSFRKTVKLFYYQKRKTVLDLLSSKLILSNISQFFT